MNDRIEQFRKMTEADPANELGHFSLGRAYLDTGDAPAAAAAFRKAIELNANLTRAYQLLATALLKLNDRAGAIEQLKKGVDVANRRGDLMPRNEMARMLSDLGESVSQAATAAGPAQVGADQVLCARCGQAGPKLPKPPFRNSQGQLIHQKVCANCWREWIAMGTKVINELRLPMSDPQAQKIFDQHMMEFLNLE